MIPWQVIAAGWLGGQVALFLGVVSVSVPLAAGGALAIVAALVAHYKSPDRGRKGRPMSRPKKQSRPKPPADKKRITMPMVLQELDAIREQSTEWDRIYARTGKGAPA